MKGASGLVEEVRSLIKAGLFGTECNWQALIGQSASLLAPQPPPDPEHPSPFTTLARLRQVWLIGAYCRESYRLSRLGGRERV